MTAPFTDDYREGEMVQCQRCAKNVRVKYYDRDTVVVVSTQEQQTLALRCQYCGYVMCDSCAHPADSLFPVCPSCQREWGPYYFTHDAISPSSSKAALTEAAPPVEKPKPQVQTPVFEAPPAPSESLGAGEADMVDEFRDWDRKRGFRKILGFVLAFLLVGAILLLATGPGKPFVKKGLALISTRSTRAPTAVVLLNETLTPAEGKPTQTIPSTPKASLTPIQPSLTSAAPIQAKPTNKVTVPLITPTPTPQPTASATSTATIEFTSTTFELISPDCKPALSVTLDDVGKTICVTGTVVFTLQTDTAFTLFFSNDDGYFRIVIYDRVPKDIKKGVCIRVKGEIKVLTGIPVMALGFNDVIEICSP